MSPSRATTTAGSSSHPGTSPPANAAVNSEMSVAPNVTSSRWRWAALSAKSLGTAELSAQNRSSAAGSASSPPYRATSGSYSRNAFQALSPVSRRRAAHAALARTVTGQSSSRAVWRRIRRHGPWGSE